jgi:hypothetical protein
MARGIDILLAHPNADATRVAVAGMSGGGWQTLTISALDPRVTLCNPVAGYSSFRTRARYVEDLGDSEQTPCDLATFVDYTHLTALLAPRPALLTYNVRDNCCFASDHALPPLWDAALPIYRLHGREARLRSHVNHDPGDHNFGVDNRQALYRMFRDFFYDSSPSFNTLDIPSENEVQSATNLWVELPPGNASFNTLALDLSRQLPRQPPFPTSRGAAIHWQQTYRAKLRELVRARDYAVTAEDAGEESREGIQIHSWRLRVGEAWTVPVVELRRGTPGGTVLVLSDGGRRNEAAEAERWLAAGRRVVFVDPFYFGESKIKSHDFLYALLVAAVGERPLGIQSSQVAAVARWAATRSGPDAAQVELVSKGPRSSVIALTAAALEEKAIHRVELQGAMGSLKEVLEKNLQVGDAPELFCFGLLESFDLKHLAALVAPRPVVFVSPSDRVRQEMTGLENWYTTLGHPCDPLRLPLTASRIPGSGD